MTHSSTWLVATCGDDLSACGGSGGCDLGLASGCCWKDCWEAGDDSREGTVWGAKDVLYSGGMMPASVGSGIGRWLF